MRGPSGRLGPGRVLGYGIGDFAFNLSFTFCTLFLLYYYTDVLGLSARTGGLIIMAALVWEGVSDPLVGYMVGRTRTRWGRYRPYLLFGCLPLALAFVAMFVPTGATGTTLALQALVAHMAFRTAYTVISVPYIALSAQMTDDSLARGQLAGARMFFAILCGLTLGAATLPLVAMLGGGRDGFLHVAVIYGAASVAILLACFAVTREAVPGMLPASPPPPDLRATLRSLAVNRPFQLLLGATLFGSVGYTMGNKALIYYVKYHGGSEAAVTTALTVALGTAAVAVWPWMTVTRVTSKRTAWLSAVAMAGTASLSIYALVPPPGALLWLLLALLGAGNAGFVLTFWSMLPDTVEYGEVHGGVRVEGAAVGLVAFSQKVALGLGTGLFGVLLDAFGYVPNVVQGTATLHGILLMFTLVPLTLGLCGAAIIWFYPLDRAAHAALVEKIAAGRHR